LACFYISAGKTRGEKLRAPADSPEETISAGVVGSNKTKSEAVIRAPQGRPKCLFLINFLLIVLLECGIKAGY
jgi:hypothetical protein